MYICTMEKKVICGIYKITSPSGRVYVGHSKDIKSRWVSYKRLACKKQTRLYKSLTKYGSENHTFEIIEECEFEQLNIRERYWQDCYNVIGRRGLNCNLTNTNELKLIHSENTIKKLREARKGKVCSEETISKIRDFQKGRKHTQETKKQMSTSQLGYKNHQSKLVLHLDTGIFYETANEAAKACGMNKNTFCDYLSGKRKTKVINYIYV